MIPDLVISIINHSNPEMLRDCLRSIHASTTSIQFEILIIDNATDQRLVPELQTEFPAIKWIFNQQRLGFSANHNQALSSATARYFCILNDDTLIYEYALEDLVHYLDAHPKAGMAGPRVLNVDGSIQNSTFREKTLLGELIGILQLPGGLNRLKLRGIDPAQFGDQPASVDWVLGACIVIRKEALEQIGVLDDVMSPLANCEEIDWCARVRKAGWTVDFVPSAKITHIGGQSLKSDASGPDRFRIEMHRVTLAYFRKQHGWLSSMVLRWIYISTLPWNGFMLAQSSLRGRIDKREAATTWSTLVGIAAIALKPLRKPYCRMESSATTRSINGRAPLNIFVQRASECLTDYYPNGDGLICFSLLGELARRGHRVFAYTNRDEVKDRPDKLEIKAHRHRVPANSLADFEHGWQSARWLKQIEKTQPIDLVWRMQPLGESCPTVPYTNGRPLVLGQLFYQWPQESAAPNDAGKPRFGFGIRDIVSPIANRGWDRTLKAASLVLCTTDALSEKTRAKTSAKVATLPVIVEPPANLVIHDHRPLSPPKLKLLFVANLNRNKKPLIFCQVIYRLRHLGVEATGEIIGDGPEREMMEAWCRSNGIADAICFAGRIPNLEVYGRLAEADGLVSTSLGEPYGRSIAEAMSVGAVPICHRSGGPADIIFDGIDGLLIDQLDGNDYSDAIYKIWQEPGAWQRLSTAAREKSLQWRPAAVIDRLENALYAVVGKGSAA